MTCVRTPATPMSAPVAPMTLQFEIFHGDANHVAQYARVANVGFMNWVIE